MKVKFPIFVLATIFCQNAHAQAVGTTYVTPSGTVGINMGSGMGMDVSGDHMGQLNLGTSLGGVRMKSMQMGDSETNISPSVNSDSSESDDSPSENKRTPAQIKADRILEEKEYADEAAARVRAEAIENAKLLEERKNLNTQLTAYYQHPAEIKSAQGITAGEIITVQPNSGHGTYVELKDAQGGAYADTDALANEQWYIQGRYLIGSDGKLSSDPTPSSCTIGYSDRTGSPQLKVLGLMASGNALVELTSNANSTCASHQRMLIPVSALTSMKTNPAWKDPHPIADRMSSMETALRNLVPGSNCH